MDRNKLKGKEGDRIKALVIVCGYNMRKTLRAFIAFFCMLKVRGKAPLPNLVASEIMLAAA
jgi:hypothetical protein